MLHHLYGKRIVGYSEHSLQSVGKSRKQVVLSFDDGSALTITAATEEMDVQFKPTEGDYEREGASIHKGRD